MVCAYAEKRSGLNDRSPLKWFINLVATIILGSGLYYQWQSYLKHPYSQVNGLSNITQMYIDIGDYANRKHWSYIRYSTDNITDYLFFSSLRTQYYEKRSKLLNVILNRMGHTMFLPITKQEALQSLHNSNVVILTIGKYPSDNPLPFFQSVATFRPELLEYAEKHFKALGDYRYQD
jgi:hypothetical protein